MLPGFDLDLAKPIAQEKEEQGEKNGDAQIQRPQLQEVPSHPLGKQMADPKPHPGEDIEKEQLTQLSSAPKVEGATQDRCDHAAQDKRWKGHGSFLILLNDSTGNNFITIIEYSNLPGSDIQNRLFEYHIQFTVLNINQ